MPIPPAKKDGRTSGVVMQNQVSEGPLDLDLGAER
jgi:hypothetical protein